MNALTRPSPARSQRDELEQLQGELRDVRQQRETLPRENAELKARVDTLDEEVRWLRRTLEQARGEWERPVPSLPDQLVVPFQATPSRRTAYGRMRFALRALVPVVSGMGYVGSTMAFSLFEAGGLLLLILASFALLLVLQGDEDDDEVPAWSFEAEGFSQVRGPWAGHTVPYTEVKKVEVDQGWLQRRYGFGTVRVTFEPSAPTPVGKALSYPNRSVDLELLDDPVRLATWLREQVNAAREKGASRGG